MHEAIINRAAEILANREGNAGYCVLAQSDTDGYPTAATITVVKTEGIKWVTFGTGLDSNWVKRANHDSRASLCFNCENPLFNITLTGTLDILTEPDIKKEMWPDWGYSYFSGPEDPGFCVLRFNTQRYSLMVSAEEMSVRGAL